MQAEAAERSPSVARQSALQTWACTLLNLLQRLLRGRSLLPKAAGHGWQEELPHTFAPCLSPPLLPCHIPNPSFNPLFTQPKNNFSFEKALQKMWKSVGFFLFGVNNILMSLLLLNLNIYVKWDNIMAFAFLFLKTDFSWIREPIKAISINPEGNETAFQAL